jgi:hypothetical protein
MLCRQLIDCLYDAVTEHTKYIVRVPFTEIYYWYTIGRKSTVPSGEPRAARGCAYGVVQQCARGRRGYVHEMECCTLKVGGNKHNNFA